MQVLSARIKYHTGVCEKNTAPEKKACGKISFQSNKSGAGQQLLLQDCRAKARTKGVLFRTPVVLRRVMLVAYSRARQLRRVPERAVCRPSSSWMKCSLEPKMAADHAVSMTTTNTITNAITISISVTTKFHVARL